MIKILIAEDEALERKFLLKILADALGSAAELRDVENGLQAVELARLWRPDLLLLDIRMPGRPAWKPPRKYAPSCPMCGSP